MKPSCGPFEGLDSAYQIVPQLISQSSNDDFITAWNFIGSVGFGVPLLIVLMYPLLTKNGPSVYAGCW